MYAKRADQVVVTGTLNLTGTDFSGDNVQSQIAEAIGHISSRLNHQPIHKMTLPSSGNQSIAFHNTPATHTGELAPDTSPEHTHNGSYKR